MQREIEKHPVIVNLLKIMNDRGLKQNSFAMLIGFPESKLSKILAEKQSLSIVDLSKIARSLNMREIDIITYPKKFRETQYVNNDIKAQLTVELNDELKEDVLKLVFANNNLKIISNEK